MSLQDNEQTIQCASCGLERTEGKFCSHCGEKALKKEDKSIGHFFEELVHGLTHADSKFLKSLKYLFTKPGFLTVEYLNGRRKGYTAPLSLFLIANLLYFLVPMIDALDSHYVTQTRGQVYSASIQQVGEQKMKERNWTKEQLSEHYDAKSSKISKLLLVLLIFLFSVPVALLYYKRGRYYFDHVIFATEFMTFLMLGILILLPLTIWVVLFCIAKISRTSQSFHIGSMNSLVLLMLILFSYFAFAGKRAYQQPWGFVLPKALGLVIGIAAAVSLYRYILFYLTMWMI